MPLSESCYAEEVVQPTPYNFKKALLISVVALVIIASIAIGVIGLFAIAGKGVVIFRGLNIAISSNWQGMPYLMAAMGAPGVLAVLGLMVWRLVAYIQSSKRHQTIDKQLGVQEENRGQENNGMQEECDPDGINSLMVSDVDRYTFKSKKAQKKMHEQDILGPLKNLNRSSSVIFGLHFCAQSLKGSSLATFFALGRKIAEQI